MKTAQTTVKNNKLPNYCYYYYYSNGLLIKLVNSAAMN